MNDLIKEDYKLLLEKGNLGFYNSAEITNIYLISKSEKNPINVFSLVVFEEKECSSSREKRKNLTNKLIPIDSRKLGISQKRISLNDSETIFNNLLKDTNIWDLNEGNDDDLQIGSLKIIPKQFIPSTEASNEKFPLNSTLKNNNENGSYIIEFFSENKPLLTSPTEKLSEEDYNLVCEKIMNILPIDLLFLKDRINNVIFQFPISLISVYTKALDNWDGIELKSDWHPLLKDIPDVEFFTYNIFDNNIMGVKTSDRLNGEIKSGNINGENIGMIKNKENDLIIWYSKSHYIKRFGISSGIMDYEPRIVDIDGTIHKIPLVSHKESQIGNFDNDYLYLINNREYEESTKKLINNKEFLQYNINGIEERDKARKDLQFIINKNCQNGVYIWDPYADSKDLLSTAYFCKYSNKKIKVINSFPKTVRKKFEDWKQDQIDLLKKNSNNRGINLEIRCRVNNHGWNFHDRFLIFPLESPKVWSLGSSINSIGKKHSILMAVNNPKNILDAFEYLWNNLEDSILWKYPEK